jgi:hypothetical protein
MLRRVCAPQESASRCREPRSSIRAIFPPSKCRLHVSALNGKCLTSDRMKRLATRVEINADLTDFRYRHLAAGSGARCARLRTTPGSYPEMVAAAKQHHAAFVADALRFVWPTNAARGLRGGRLTAALDAHTEICTTLLKRLMGLGTVRRRRKAMRLRRGLTWGRLPQNTPE